MVGRQLGDRWYHRISGTACQEDIRARAEDRLREVESLTEKQVRTLASASAALSPAKKLSILADLPLESDSELLARYSSVVIGLDSELKTTARSLHEWQSNASTVRQEVNGRLMSTWQRECEAQANMLEKLNGEIEPLADEVARCANQLGKKI